MRSRVPIPEEMPESSPSEKRTISRRRALELGAKAAAGASLVATTGWVKPQLATVKLEEGCSGSPPPGQPSAEVWKDAEIVKRFGQQIAIAGTIKITNASEVQIVVEKIDDIVQYRDGNNWKDAPTSLQLSGCGEGSCIDPRHRCSADYTALATVPLDADRFRNRVEVKLMFRDKIFSYTSDVEDASGGPPEEPPPEPEPSEPPPSEPPPSEPPPEPSPSGSPP
jgi:hypothetical protein